MSIGLRPLDDNSALTHLATGRLILAEGIPRHDPFSFTAAGQPWTVYSWLASTGTALADRLGGGNGIQVLHAVLTTSLAVLVWRLTHSCRPVAGRIIAAAVALLIASGAWTERPLLVALLLFAVVVVTVESEGSPWLIGVVLWLWVNVHGSFPLVIVYLVVRLIGRRLDGHPVYGLARLARGAVLGALLGAINPLGPRLLVFPIELLGRHDVLSRVQEWRSPDFSEPGNLVFLIAMLLGLLLAGQRRSFEDGLVLVVFGAAACLAIRNLAPATIVLAPALARGLDGLGEERGEQRSLVTAIAGGMLLAVGVALTVVALQGPAYDLRRYPVAHVDWMQAQGLLDERIATPDFVGNLIVARRGVQANVFFDDRFDLYPKAVIRDVLALLDGQEGWQNRLDKYEIQGLLWQRSSPLAGLVDLDPEWRIVRRDESWVVALRRDSERPIVRRALGAAENFQTPELPTSQD